MDQAAGPRFRAAIAAAIRFTPGVIVPAVASLAAASIYTRTLSPAAYGTASFVLASCIAIVTTSTQWLQQAALRYLPVARDERHADETRETLGAALLLLTAGALLVGFLIAAVLSATSLLPRWLLLPALLMTVASIPFHTSRAVLQAEYRSRTYSVFQTLFALVGLGIGVWWNDTHRDGSGLIWGPAVATVLLVPFLWRAAHFARVKKLARGAIGHLGGIKPIARYGTPMIGWFIAASSFDLGNRFVISSLRGAHELGIYSASYSLMSGAATLMGAPLILALHPHLMRSMADSDPDHSRALMRKLIGAGFVACAAGVAVTALLARKLSVLLGVEFREGYRIFPVAVGAAVLWQIGMLAHKPLEYGERTRTLLLIAVTIALANIALNVLFVGRYGYVAAPYVTAACFAAYAIWVTIAAASVRLGSKAGTEDVVLAVSRRSV